MQWYNNNHKKSGMDLLCVFGGGYPLALARGGMGVVQFFMIKRTNIRDKIRYSNLSNNMMIQFYIITIQIQ